MANMKEQRPICRNNGQYAGTMANMQEQWPICRNNGQYAGTMANMTSLLLPHNEIGILLLYVVVFVSVWRERGRGVHLNVLITNY